MGFARGAEVMLVKVDSWQKNGWNEGASGKSACSFFMP